MFYQVLPQPLPMVQENRHCPEQQICVLVGSHLLRNIEVNTEDNKELIILIIWSECGVIGYVLDHTNEAMVGGDMARVK